MKLPTLDAVNRELAARSLYEFVKQAWPYVESVPLIDNWHIRALCEHLQAQTNGEIENLLINIPPGCSKSLITCVFWPAWEWIANPASRWFTASYDARLSTRDAVKTRALIGSQWYQTNWGSLYQITKGQDQKTYYETDQGGYRLASPCGGHGTGEHPDHIVLDDPHDVSGAESAAERLSTLEWWDLTMSTRGVSRGVKRTIIMQRLHERDMSGHVLASEEAWVHICLPMRYETGRMELTPLGWTDPRTEDSELLTPGQFSAEIVKQIESRLGSYGSAGQLQQRPAPREGGMFKRHWFEVVGAVPADAQRVRYWDLASTQDGGDYTAGVKMSKTTDGIFYVENIQRDRLSPHGVEQLVKQTAELDGRDVRIFMEQEPGSSGVNTIDYYTRLLAGYSFRGIRSTGDKIIRADPFAAQAEAGNVKLVKGDWNEPLLNELTVFPNGVNDDQVDACSGAITQLTTPEVLPGYARAGRSRSM